MTWCHRKKQKRRWTNIRFSAFLDKLSGEEKKKEARIRFTSVLSQVSQKRSEEEWEKIVKILADFQKEINELGKIPSNNAPIKVIEFCVQIFEISSRYQDILGTGIEVFPEEKQEAVKKFNNNLYFVGRHDSSDFRNDTHYGKVPYWNTTQKGEVISMDNICFGPELALSRKPASYWVNLSKKKKINVLMEISYTKGRVQKPISIWQTEALVKIGIHNFCKSAISSLNENFEELLADESLSE